MRHNSSFKQIILYVLVLAVTGSLSILSVNVLSSQWQTKNRPLPDSLFSDYLPWPVIESDSLMNHSVIWPGALLQGHSLDTIPPEPIIVNRNDSLYITITTLSSRLDNAEGKVEEIYHRLSANNSEALLLPLYELTTENKLELLSRDIQSLRDDIEETKDYIDGLFGIIKWVLVSFVLALVLILIPIVKPYLDRTVKHKIGF